MNTGHITNDIGRVIPLHKGEYSATTPYELNDCVSFQGSTYWHYKPEETIGVLPTDETVWRLMTNATDVEPYVERALQAAEDAEKARDATKAIEGTKAPTRHTVGSIGQRYIDTVTGKTYICVEIRKAEMPGYGTIYGWMPLFVPNDEYDDFGNLYIPIGQSVIAGGEHCYIATDGGHHGAEYLYGITTVLAGLADKDGNITSNIHYSISADANTLPLRDSNGNIKVGTPVEDEDAVPKSYADGKVDDSTTDTEHAWSGNKVNNALNGLAQGMSGMGEGLTQAINEKLDKITTASSNSKVYGIEKDGSQTSFIVATGTTIGGIPMWDGNGALKTNAPVNNTDCANKKYVDAIKPILGGASDPDTATDAKFLGRLYINEASGDLFYAAQNIASGSYDWRHIASPEAIRQTSAPTGATIGYVGQLCLVGSSDFSPFDVYICVCSNPAYNQYLWHKMCTTEAPS